MTDRPESQTRSGLADRAAGTDVEVSRPTVFTMLDKQKPELERALPVFLKANVDAVLRQAITAVKTTKGLLECAPLEIVGAVMDVAAMGLELGPMQLAYILPFKDHGVPHATVVIGYRGYIELGYRSGLVKDFKAAAVHEDDTFDFDEAEATMTHGRDLHADRGPVYAYYARARLVTGGVVQHVMSLAEVKAFRATQRNQQYSKMDDDAYGRKTCLRRLEPFLPKGTEKSDVLMRAFAHDGAVVSGDSPDTLDVRAEWDDDEVVDAELVDAEAGAATDDGPRNYAADDPERPFDS
jgi:recombination protein RecT